MFMWVYHGLSARWVYGILDWDKPLAVVLYLFLPLFTFAGFAAWSAPPQTSPLCYMAEESRHADWLQMSAVTSAEHWLVVRHVPYCCLRGIHDGVIDLGPCTAQDRSSLGT